MEKLIRTIPVRDANGTRLTLFEFQKRVPRRGIFGLRFTSKRRRMQLDTGEAVDYLNESSFRLPNGELLCRIEPADEP
ncbi:MAG TPA: hypothetical protein VGB39_05960 [Sphingomicrobium sp.]